MAAPRFFVPPPLTPALVGQSMPLPAAAAHHAVRVLRLAVGDALTIFDGAGGEYAATLARIQRSGADVRIESFDPIERESPYGIVLAQAVAANDAMDFSIRKAVELGAAAIQPLVTERSAPMPAGERGDKRLAHWRGIVVAACEQCGRNRIPPVAAPVPWQAWVRQWNDAALVLAPGARAVLASLPRPASPVALAVGPEGGFSDRELEAALNAGLRAVSFGPRVLRTETAGVAALAAMQALWGDLR
jgi:16S rRNA (uracil1498-N3)-methyltransferase